MKPWSRNSDYWTVAAAPRGGVGTPFVVALLHSVLSAARAREAATELATLTNQPMILTLYKGGTGPLWSRSNPTLVHHGLAKAARWHVVTADGNTPVADLYDAAGPEAASRVGQFLADKLGRKLMVLSNFGTPRSLAKHSALRTRTGSVTFDPPRANPVGAPAKGETYVGPNGTVRIDDVTPTRVRVLELATGNRVWVDRAELVAAYRTPSGLMRRPKLNPKARRAGALTWVPYEGNDYDGRRRVIGVHADTPGGDRYWVTRHRNQAGRVVGASVQFNTQQADARGWHWRDLGSAATLAKGKALALAHFKGAQPPTPNARRKRARRARPARSRAGRFGPRARVAVASARWRRNPSKREQLRKAADVFEMWHEFPPEKITRMKIPSRTIPEHLVALGEVLRIDYKSNKWEGKPVAYTHATKRPRPVLATDPDARQLYLVGGKMRPTADGLVN